MRVEVSLSIKHIKPTMVSTIETPPTGSVVIQNLTTSMIDNMFIVSPPQEVAEAVEEQGKGRYERRPRGTRCRLFGI